MITHQNDEAYVGAKCIVVVIQSIIKEDWVNGISLFDILIEEIPDSKVRDRLIKVKYLENLNEIAEFGNDGYVVNSVPLAIAAANIVKEIGLEEMFNQLIKIGGDTDTNCSIAGQISGAFLGINNIPEGLKSRLTKLQEYDWINSIINRFIISQNL